MKLHHILFMICFISISFIGYSQDKGYYSIGNNVEKLKIKNDGNPVDSFSIAEKGYYNMEPNRRKLKKSLKEEKVGRKPKVKKGYYSIGSNADQLKDHQY